MIATQILQLTRVTSTMTNAHGETVRVYGAPEDWSVYGWAPGDNRLPSQKNRSSSVIEWTVYAPADDGLPHEFDKVAVNGDDFLVAGRPGDWTNGPWGPAPFSGATVFLTRTEG